MTFEFLFGIFIVQQIRKYAQTATLYPRLNKFLIGCMVAAGILLVLEISLPASKQVTKWVAHLFLWAIVFFVFRLKEFRQVRQFMYAILPFMVIALFSDLIERTNSKFYKEWEDYFDTGIIFSMVWLVAMWIIVSRQKKALEKERLKREQEEKENAITVRLKAELELQVIERTAQLTQQKEELQHALAELKSTQTQLIQSEKMASLGELTAGIAHEIQNPLNFVNNFSEVSSELLDEMQAELNAGNKEDAFAIAADVKRNLEKIIHHGKRADDIVKGMLQHSRTSTGQKEPADINAMADEYLRLSYHGLRAKDKFFNATMDTYFDENIGTVNVIPQDLGRALLNLFTNAFYSVTEKKNRETADYKPIVSVTSKKLSNAIEIRVKDNGMGIPQKMLDKIFNPFFTTKPTGQGTGLGLSLSYDIITKVHGGSLKVETKEGEFAEFVIELPA